MALFRERSSAGDEPGDGRRRAPAYPVGGLRALAGEVVEIGFGTGLNLPHLPAAVTRLYAVDPLERGRVKAADALAASPVAVEFVGLDGQSLPLADGSVDAALSTWTLCSVTDPLAAVSELAAGPAAGRDVALRRARTVTRSGGPDVAAPPERRAAAAGVWLSPDPRHAIDHRGRGIRHRPAADVLRQGSAEGARLDVSGRRRGSVGVRAGCGRAGRGWSPSRRAAPRW